MFALLYLLVKYSELLLLQTKPEYNMASTPLSVHLLAISFAHSSVAILYALFSAIVVLLIGESI